MEEKRVITVSVKNRWDAVKTAGLKDRTAVISIRDAMLSRPEFEESQNLVDVLRLTFSDVEDGESEGMIGFHAVAVRQFLAKNLANIDRLTVHCTFGQHRSAAIAAAILKTLSGDETILHHDYMKPNNRCYKLMCEELEKVKNQEPFCDFGFCFEDNESQAE